MVKEELQTLLLNLTYQRLKELLVMCKSKYTKKTRFFSFFFIFFQVDRQLTFSVFTFCQATSVHLTFFTTDPMDYWPSLISDLMLTDLMLTDPFDLWPCWLLTFMYNWPFDKLPFWQFTFLYFWPYDILPFEDLPFWQLAFHQDLPPGQISFWQLTF